MATHKLQDLERIASNNPAMTVPASSTMSWNTRQRPTTATSRVAGGEQINSDPAGDMAIVKEEDSQDLSKYDKGWRRVVRNFSPSWFSTTMGTGIVSLLFVAIPWEAAWLYWFGVFFFGLNTILFTISFSISVARYTFYPEIWKVMIRDPTNSLFLGTIPMGFATMIEAWVIICCPYWGNWSVTFIWVLWMIDAIVSILVTTSLSFLLISASHQQSLDRITAAQLLPIAATIVASGGGARVAEELNKFNPEYALGTSIAGYVMWGMSTPLAMVVLVMYYQRLALHKLPPREIVVSSFLPLGPLGMGGWTIMYLGKVMREILPRVGFLSHVPITADILYILGIFIALIMWSFGLIWGIFAVATISRSPNGFPFNMGWWGFTFPLGVFALSTMQLGKEMPSLFFRVLGTIFAVMVMLLWVVVAAGTLRGAWNGKLFYAPCLKNLPPKNQESDKVGHESKKLETV